MRVRFATQSYQSETLQLSAQRCVNMYAERQPPDAKTDVAVFGCPGIVTDATCGLGPIRGMHVMGDVLYVVSAGLLYRVTSSWEVDQIGGTITGSGRVGMADNGSQLAIVNGEFGYIYSTAGGFQLISDTDFNAAKSVTYQDGRFIFDDDGTNEFFISDSLDGSSYDGTAFATAEWKSDNVVAVKNHLQLLHIFGTETTEVYQNVGAANFPFQRIQGVAIDRGLIAPHALVSESQKLHLVGSDRVFYELVGQTPNPTTTAAIAAAWQKYETVDDAHCLSFTFNGHKFIVTTFPKQSASWCRDITTGLWHERVSHDTHGNSLGRWRGNCSVLAYGKEMIGDQYSGKIGHIDGTVFTEFGDQIRGELVSPPIHGDGKRVFMPWFELDVETGVGLITGQGSTPYYMLDISDDGGRTWSDQQPWQSAGAQGQYLTQLRWDRLGSFYERCLRVTISDPVRRAVLAARCPELSVGE